MLAPQSGQDVQQVVDGLRRIDPLLDVRWEPQAVLVRRGSYGALGTRIDAEYDGRWQVIRHDKAVSLHPERDYVVVAVVTQLSTDSGPPMMLDRGPYAPLGSWLVEHMRYWDAAQSAFSAHMDAAWAQHERVDALDVTNERAMNQEALEKVYREHGGGEYWMGRGMGDGTTTRVATQAAKTAPRTLITTL